MTKEEGRTTEGPYELPAGWVWTTLGEISDTTRNRRHPQDYPNIPYVGMEHVEANTMKLLGTVPAGDLRSTAEYFEPGDVLYGRLRPYLNKVFRPTFEGLCSAEFIVFHRTPGVDSRYLQYFLNSSAFVSFASHLNAGDRPRVNFDQLADYAIPLPPEPEQRRIVAKIEELLTSLDAGVASLKRVQATLKRYRAAVLKAACEGRLVPQDPNDEPAEKLLERLLVMQRQQLYEAKLHELKSHLDLQISTDGVHRSPYVVVLDWLVEMVINDIDKLPGNPVDGLAAALFGPVSAKVAYTSVTIGPISHFFETVHDNIQIGETERNYVRWLIEAIGVLASQGIQSKVLESQLRVWMEYINTELNARHLPRTIHVPFGAAGSIIGGIGEWLAADRIRDISLSDIRRTHIDEPVAAERRRERDQQVFSDSSDSPGLPPGWRWTTIGKIAECLDRRRVPVNKKNRAEHAGLIPYYGANGQVGFTDGYLFDEPLVLVVEDETFTGREKPFSYKISGKSWVNNHAHVLRATGLVDTDYLNYSLAHYPFTPLTTGTTGRRKLTQQALMQARFPLPPLAEQLRIVREIERRISVVDELEKMAEANLMRAERLRQAILRRAFEGELVGPVEDRSLSVQRG